MDFPFCENTMISFVYLFGGPPLLMKWEVALARREQQQLVKDEAKPGKNPAHETPHVGTRAWVTRELRENLKMKTQILVLRPS